MWRLRPAISPSARPRKSAVSRNGSAEAERVGAHQQEPAPGGAALGGERQDGAEHRADAGGPAEGEGEPEEVGAERGPGLAARLEADVAREERQAQHAEEMQAEEGDDDPGRDAHLALPGEERAAERRGGEAEEEEDGREAEDEEECGAQRARLAAGRAPPSRCRP